MVHQQAHNGRSSVGHTADDGDAVPGWQRAIAEVGRHWVLAAIQGAVTVILGVLILVWPGASLLVIVYLFAIYLLVQGIWQVVSAIADPGDGTGGNRVLMGVLGGLSFLVGLLCLREPLQTLAVIALLIGAWLLVGGVIMVISALTGATIGSRVWVALGGLLCVIGGVVVLLQPAISLVTLQVVLGCLLVLQGALVATGALAIRLSGETRKWTPPDSAATATS